MVLSSNSRLETFRKKHCRSKGFDSFHNFFIKNLKEKISVLAFETLDVQKKFNKKEYYWMNIPPLRGNETENELKTLSIKCAYFWRQLVK